MCELWFPLEGYEGYEVSTLGRLRSLDRYVDHKDGTQSFRAGVIRKPFVNQGYNVYWIKGKVRKASQLVCITFFGPRGKGVVVRHLNGDSLDDRVDNLSYGSQKQNIGDMLAQGTQVNQRKTHCPQGHEYSGDNLWRDSHSRGRVCRTCKLEKTKEYRGRVMASTYPLQEACRRLGITAIALLERADEFGVYGRAGRGARVPKDIVDRIADASL